MKKILIAALCYVVANLIAYFLISCAIATLPWHWESNVEKVGCMLLTWVIYMTSPVFKNNNER